MATTAVDVEALALLSLVQVATWHDDPWLRLRRPEQTPPPGVWRTWLFLAGRGAGKTRTAAEWIRQEVMAGRARRVALVGPTAADVRDVMVRGPSGILASCERIHWPATYAPTLRRITFANGAEAMTYSAEEPERLRGPEHDLAWCDELGAWNPHRAEDAWHNLQLGLRLLGPRGDQPRQIVTTTPRRTPVVRALVAAAAAGTGEVVLARSTTFANAANLAPAFLAAVEARYAGTRLGRQELLGELIEDVEGALWSLDQIDRSRVPAAPDLVRIVVGVDPPATSEGAEAGIVVAGRSAAGEYFVLDDCSRRASPLGWATAAVAAYDRWQADAVVIEVNQGGEMATETLRRVRSTLPIRPVRASRGKFARAEPIAALYEQGRVHHAGAFPALEDQLTTWVPGEASPDRLDALVWALTELSEREPAPRLAPVALPHASPWNMGGRR